MTAKANTAPSPSSTRASATEMPTGPATVAEFEFDSGRPSSMQTAPAASQSVVAGSDTVTSSDERGRTVIVQRWFSDSFDFAGDVPVCPTAPPSSVGATPSVTSAIRKRSIDRTSGLPVPEP